MSKTKDWGRAKVGLDGSCGFALLGENLQDGEAEFVEIDGWPQPTYKQERAAWGAALRKLEERLGSGLLRYEVVNGGPSSSNEQDNAAGPGKSSSPESRREGNGVPAPAAPSEKEHEDAARVFPIARPVRDWFGTILDAENRQIAKAPPEYAVQIVHALNSLPFAMAALIEECAKVCDERASYWADQDAKWEQEVEAARCAEAIRSMSSTAKREGECPHAAPFKYCQQCVVSPCPIGLGPKE